MTNIVSPGDHLSIIEEYQSGKNTIEYNGNIIATVHGSKEIDEENKVINVDPTNNRRIYPKIDDEIIGKIVNVRNNNYFIEIIKINGNQVPRYFTAVLNRDTDKHIIKMDLGFVGDYLKARILKVNNGKIYLNFNGTHLGILKTECGSCGSDIVELDNESSIVKCNKCKNVRRTILPKMSK